MTGRTGGAGAHVYARSLVLRHGWNATAYQILNPGVRRWFSAGGDAVAGYVRRVRVFVADGAPVCPPERLAPVVREWEAWVARSLPPLHFLVEPDTLGDVADRRVFVAEWGENAGEIVGFLVASPIPARAGWLVEEVIRWPGCPPWLQGLIAWVRAHGRRFLNFDGLEAFKAKFRPQAWEPVYVFSREARFSLSTLHAVASALTGEGTSPLRAVARVLVRAARQEVAWLAERRQQPGRAFVGKG